MTSHFIQSPDVTRYLQPSLEWHSAPYSVLATDTPNHAKVKLISSAKMTFSCRFWLRSLTRLWGI